MNCQTCNVDDTLKVIKYITNILNENHVVLDDFKKEIEDNKDIKTSFSTLVYDNRINNCNTILEALEKQIPRKAEDGTEGGFDWYCICGNYLCATKRAANQNGIKYCPNCGQKLNWEDTK